MSRIQYIGAFFFRFRGHLPLFYTAVLLPLSINNYSELFNADLSLYMKVISITFILLGILIRVLVVGYKAPHTSGRNRHEQVAHSLNTTGLYSVIQHPLYFGSFLIWIGLSILLNNLIFFIGLILFSLVFFRAIIQVESNFLKERFGDSYVKWSNRTPVYYLNPFLFVPTKNSFDWIRVFATEYPSWISIIAGLLLVDLLTYYFAVSDEFLPLSIYRWIFIGIAIGIGGRFFKYIVVRRWLKRSI